MWTRSKVIPDCFTVSSETSDIYKCAERLPIMPLLDLNIKSGVETFRGTEKLLESCAAARNDIEVLLLIQ